MNICGIIAEYNPMHLGHNYQLQEAIKQTDAKAVVLIMSGNFVQRGEPAIIDKYHRTKSALLNGVDLVIELPTYFATSSAEYFAEYSIRLLNEMKVITHLNFGSESGSISNLHRFSDVLCNEPTQYKEALNRHLSEGQSFPKARALALKQYFDDNDTLDDQTLLELNMPNNILGIEYLKALNRLNSDIIPTTTKRIGSTYHDENSEDAIPSATALRKLLSAQTNYNAIASKVPLASFTSIKEAIEAKEGPIFPDDLFFFLKHKILSDRPEKIATYIDISEGLQNRIYDCALTATSYEDLIYKIATKRYTRTRIARALLHIYLGHTQGQLEHFRYHMKPYLKVLGFSDKGKQIIRKVKDANETLAIIVNTKHAYKQLDVTQRVCFNADLDSTLLYNLLIQSKYIISVKNDYQRPVIMI